MAKMTGEEVSKRVPLPYFLAFLCIKVLIQIQRHKFSTTMSQNIYMNSEKMTKSSDAVNILNISNY